MARDRTTTPWARPYDPTFAEPCGTHGANIDHGPAAIPLLRTVVPDVSLLKWLIDHGADINQDSQVTSVASVTETH